MRTPRNRPAKRPALPAALPDVAAAVVPDDDGDESSLDALSELVAQLGDVGGFVARLDRVPAANLPAELTGYLGSLDFSAASFLDDVRDQHGGGKFRVRIYDARNEYRTSFRFTIAGPPKRHSDAAAAPSAAHAAPADDRLERALAAMADAQRETLTMLARAAAAPSAPPVDPLAQILGVAKLLRELTPAAAPGTSPADMFATLSSMMDLRERIVDSAPKSSGGGFDTVVEHGVKPIVSLMERRLNLEADAMQDARERRRGAIAAGSAVGHISTHAAADPIARLAAQVPSMARSYLAGVARAEKDPALYAELVLDTLPDDAYAELPALLNRPDFAAVLCGAVPEWSAFVPWFALLADNLRAALIAAAAESDGGEGGEGAAPDDAARVPA